MQKEKCYHLEHCNMAIEDEEQSRIMYKLMELKPHKSAVYTYDEMGVAALIADVRTDILYCTDIDAWYVWNGSKWEKQNKNTKVSDKVQEVFNLLRLYCKEFEAADKVDEIKEYKAFCTKLRRKVVVFSVIELLKSHVDVNSGIFDTQPYLLNTPSLTIDMKNFEAVSDRRNMFLTQCTNCDIPEIDINYRCERFYSFIDQIMSHDKEKAAFLQRALGYSVLGINKSECMFLAYGSLSRNGKSTLFHAINGVIGKDYMGAASPSLICVGKNRKPIDPNSPQPALRKLVKLRLVTISEIDKNQVLDGGFLKALTGRDSMDTRGLHESSFDFRPEFNLWLNTNHLPIVTDDRIFKSDRVWVIPFNEHYDENARDDDLKEIFSDPKNQPTILEWLIKGLSDYMKYGLNPPKCVRDATTEYRAKYDRIGCFIKECCKSIGTARITVEDFYTAYKDWCDENGYTPFGKNNVTEELRLRGYRVDKMRSYNLDEKGERKTEWCIDGISLVDNVDKVEHKKIKLS